MESRKISTFIQLNILKTIVLTYIPSFQNDSCFKVFTLIRKNIKFKL